MKILRALILTLCLLAAPHFAAGGNLGGLLFNIDGRNWPAFPESSKDIYLQGILDGLSLVDQKSAKITLSSTLTASEYREAVDKFYEDPKNRWMPLIISLTIISMEAQGKPRKEIDKFIEEIRELQTKVKQ